MVAQASIVGVRVALVLGTSTGGMGRHVQSLAAGLTDRGAHVTVLAATSTEATFGFSSAGATYVEWNVSDRPRPARDLGAVRRMRRVMRTVDVVHAHGLRAGGLSALALAGMHHPALVVTVHNAVAGGRAVKTAYLILERIVARKAGAVLAVSPDLVARANHLGARAVTLAHVAAPQVRVNESDVAALRAELAAGDRPLVVAAGRLTEQKGFRTLLDASAAWRRRAVVPLVVIAGDGPLAESLAARIRTECLPVQMLGHRDDVATLLDAAAVVVVPSLWEGQPLLVEEVLRAGRPMVATAVGGIPTMVGDAARLMPPSDPERLAVEVRGVLDSPELARSLSARALERASALPSETDVLDQVVAEYLRVALTATYAWP